MNTHPLRPPTKPIARSDSLNIRLTPQERAAIDAVAKEWKVTPSHFARHYLLQIVAFHAGQKPIGKQ